MSGETQNSNQNSENNAEVMSSEDEHDLSERLASLDARINQTRKPDTSQSDAQKATTRAGVAQAFRLSSEFIAGVVVGGAIGYGIDVFFGTSPFGMIVFLLLGFAAAVLNVMRAAGMMAESGLRIRKEPSGTSRDTKPGSK